MAITEVPARKTQNGEMVRKLVDQGLTAKQISDQTGLNYDTVYYHYRKYKNKAEDKNEAPGKRNEGRKMCKTCIYQGKKNGCDYIEHTGYRRGCNVEDCDRYVQSGKLDKKHE